VITVADGPALSDTLTGFTLYVFTQDQPNRSTCDLACSLQWPPFVVPADAAVNGDWSVAQRADGIRQWAFRGKPLYFSAQDLQPGDTRGHGADGAWQVARP
jgi:predicted lipoprotein with Yx(FWY)xxD motif